MTVHLKKAKLLIESVNSMDNHYLVNNNTVRHLITTIESLQEKNSELEMEMVLTERVVTKKEEMLKDVENRISEVIDSRDKALDEIESQKEEIEKLKKENKLLTIVNDRYTKSAMAKSAPYYNNEGVYCHGDGEPIKGYTDYKAIISTKNNKWHCCHIGCEKMADVIISGDKSYEDYTHMCNSHKDEYLDGFNNVKVEKIAHTVNCQGICTSQLDDYCGMHMSNESCIACNSIWTEAHIENAVRGYKAITELKNAEIERLQTVIDEMEMQMIVDIEQDEMCRD